MERKKLKSKKELPKICYPNRCRASGHYADFRDGNSSLIDSQAPSEQSSGVLNPSRNKIIKILEHNEHSLDITIRGRTISPCARCTGMYLGLLTIMITSFLYWLGILHFPLQLITTFILSWFFVTPAVIDWVSTKTGIRKGNNHIRVVTGFFLGIGIGTYFFLMPAGILFKVLTFITYQLMIGIPAYAIYNKKAGLPIKKQVFLFKQSLKHFFQPQERRASLADNTMGQEGIGCSCLCPLLCCCMSQSLCRGRRVGRGGQSGC